ncbi:MAG: phosphonopyruvate decarboxylase [Clostridia bacterium]|nr:phosphonopyruvate decarboxylase [Clostridia bacterium]
MKVEEFTKVLGSNFYAGVPDSQLKALCNYLIFKYGVNGKNHIIAANEGNAVGLAAGYHLATGKVPVVYMQNSGEGNVVNPVASLLNDKVYGIPCIFVIGWRGEPGVHDEPQHIFQGEITCKLLDIMDIQYMVISNETSLEEIAQKMEYFKLLLKEGKQVAFVVKKGALSFEEKLCFKNNYSMLREDIIKHIVNVSKEDAIISTTGKASRELFEIREANKQGHGYDFLTVGSMGHSSSIALEIAIQKPNKKIWIIDGDGAVLMHMGSMAVLAANKPRNIVHIVINNCSHETVGGQPTVMGNASLVKIAEGCGYPYVVCVNSFAELDLALEKAIVLNDLCFIEVKCAIGARDNLGRPTTTAKENKNYFMKSL